MNNLNKFIDTCLIDVYADGDCINGYFLDIDSIPENDRSHFLDKLMNEDTDVRDFILHAMQKLINNRLIEREVNKRQDAGFNFVQDISNGDFYLKTINY